MTRKFQQKLTGKDGLATTQQPNKNLLSGGLFKVLPNNKIDLDNPFGQFLLNPSSYDEQKISNWVAHNIPGQSDPILQWTSGGARIVTFEALVTKDHANFNLSNPPSALGAAIDGAINVVGNIASSFLGVNIPPIGDLLPIGDQGAGEQLGIHDYLNYYRSMMYPITEQDKTTLAGSPPLVALYAGKTFSKNLSGSSVAIDTDLWVVTDLRIKVTKQLPNLTPMEAVVTFQLMEYIRRTKDQSSFGQGSPDQAVSSGSLGDSIISAVSGLFS